MIKRNYRKKGNVALLLALFGLIPAAIAAEPNERPPLEIKGAWMPGGMLIGRTAPGASIEVMGHTLLADSDGRFVFGLGRDVNGTVQLDVESNGNKHTFEYPVSPREYDIQRIDGIEKKYVSPPEAVLSRIRDDAAQVSRARDVFSQETFFLQQFKRPAEGPVTGVYGSQRVFNGEPRRPHYGLDIAGPVGTPIYAPAGGVVRLAVPDMYYSGGTLIVDHGYGITSTFIHLSKILVKPGQRITQGEQIALMGSTGRVTGPHLDWRINWLDQRLDPALLLMPEEGSTSDL